MSSKAKPSPTPGLSETSAEPTRAAAIPPEPHLVQTVLAAEDAENSRIARLLHDSLGQHVAALLLGFKGLERDLSGRPGAVLTLQSLHAIAQSIGQELHQVALELRPTALDDYGLVRGLTTYLEEFSLWAKVPVEFDHHDFGSGRLSPHLERMLFRVVRDALRYVLSAAHADRVNVILSRQDGGVTAIVEATGARSGAPADGEGAEARQLATLRARAALVGGTTDLEARGDVATVFVRIPLNEP